MKKIKYYIFFLLGAAMITSCDNELTEDVNMGIGVKQNEGVRRRNSKGWHTSRIQIC